MFSFFYHIIKTLKTFFKGFKDPEYRGLWTLGTILMLSGMVFYHNIEGLRWLDALYFSFCTLTTIGYGDIVPKTDIGKIFTMIYALGGIGLFFAFINTFSELSRKPKKKSDDK